MSKYAVPGLVWNVIKCCTLSKCFANNLWTTFHRIQRDSKIVLCLFLNCQIRKEEREGNLGLGCLILSLTFPFWLYNLHFVMIFMSISAYWHRNNVQERKKKSPIVLWLLRVAHCVLACLILCLFSELQALRDLDGTVECPPDTLHSPCQGLRPPLILWKNSAFS